MAIPPQISSGTNPLTQTNESLPSSDQSMPMPADFSLQIRTADSIINDNVKTWSAEQKALWSTAESNNKLFYSHLRLQALAGIAPTTGYHVDQMKKVPVEDNRETVKDRDNQTVQIDLELRNAIDKFFQENILASSVNSDSIFEGKWPNILRLEIQDPTRVKLIVNDKRVYQNILNNTVALEKYGLLLYTSGDNELIFTLAPKDTTGKQDKEQTLVKFSISDHRLFSSSIFAPSDTNFEIAKSLNDAVIKLAKSMERVADSNDKDILNYSPIKVVNLGKTAIGFEDANGMYRKILKARPELLKNAGLNYREIEHGGKDTLELTLAEEIRVGTKFEVKDPSLFLDNWFFKPDVTLSPDMITKLEGLANDMKKFAKENNLEFNPIKVIDLQDPTKVAIEDANRVYEKIIKHPNFGKVLASSGLKIFEATHQGKPAFSLSS
jgi:hypothetical protein